MGQLILAPTDGKSMFVKSDLHVHTPSSSACYKYVVKADEAEEYLNTLYQCTEKDIKVIAITDHNSIAGYNKLMKIKERYFNEYKSLQAGSAPNNGVSRNVDLLFSGEFFREMKTLLGERQDSLGFINALESLVEQQKRNASNIEAIKRGCEAFDKLLILPGIEFEAYPGVHLLLIFDPDSDLVRIEALLESAGYVCATQGLEEPELLTNLSVNNVIRDVAELGGIVIAAHADSNKGLLEVLEGVSRVQALKTNQLIGLQLTNLKNVERANELISSAGRTDPIALIECSDYHGELSKSGKKIGECITYLKLSELSFRAVKDALLHPEECVSPRVRPDERSILTNIIKKENSILVENLEGDNFNLLIQGICAMLNSNQGQIIVGVTRKYKSVVGINKTVDVVREIVNSATSKIHYGWCTPSAVINHFEYGQDKAVYTIRILGQTNCIAYIIGDNKAYLLKKGQILEAKPQDIAEIAENRLQDKIEKQQSLFEKRISDMLGDIHLLSKTFSQMKLITRIERNGSTLPLLMSLNAVKRHQGKVATTRNYQNGDENGNAIIVEASQPRLPKAHLRFSPPCYSIQDGYCGPLEIRKTAAIIIVPGGGIYYNDSSEDWLLISKSQTNSYLLSAVDILKEKISLPAIIGWFKSSLFIWYTANSLGTLNICDSSLLSNIYIPTLKCLKPRGEIEEIVLDIIDKERKFLMVSNGLLSRFAEDTKNEEYFTNFAKMTDEHNAWVALKMNSIDTILEEQLGVTNEERMMINDFFKLKLIFKPDIKEQVNVPHPCDSEVACTI